MGNVNKTKVFFVFRFRETFRYKYGKCGISKFVESRDGLRIWQWSRVKITILFGLSQAKQYVCYACYTTFYIQICIFQL